jgi:chemotaxis protein MotC
VNSLLKTALALVLTIVSGAAIAESGQPSEVRPTPDPPRSQSANAASPVQMLRTLQLMQDQIAIGSTEAHIGQRGLLTILDNRFMDLPSEVWEDGKNIRAAIAFVLSGGNPQILRKLLEMGNPAIPIEDRSFVEGTLAYVEGREEESKGKLLSVNVQSLPPMLGAQLALVQSALVVRTDPRKSSDLLDFVRLQAPGTLLEEGALRRQVFVASQTGDVKKFLALSSGYLRRYRHSIYAGNFRQRLASALTRIDFGKDQVLFDDVVAMLMDLEPDARRDIYLLSARSSIEQGKTHSARMLAEKAKELSEGDVASAARAKLYRAAAMIVSPETIGMAVEDLKGIDRTKLTTGDATLLDSALSMAGHIRVMPGDRMADNSSKPSPPPSDVNKQQAPEQLQAVLKAQDALSRIDKLIKNQASTVQ